MEQPVILLYNLSNGKGKKIEKLSNRLKIKVKYVDASKYGEPIGFLAEIPDIGENRQAYEEPSFTDEMLIMSGFSDELLNSFLKEYKKQHMEPVALKAIITPRNRTWNSFALNKELNREREAFKRLA